MHKDHVETQSGGGTATAPVPGRGHNRPQTMPQPAQWQLRHGEAAIAEAGEGHRGDTDLDLVEAAFVEGFGAASDPMSFLRLAQVPFKAADADGTALALLRVEIDTIADVGALTPHLGGASFRYDPLPGRMVSRRKRIRLVYFDGHGLRTFGLADAMKLSAT